MAPDPNALPATHGDGASAGMARQLHAHFGATAFPFPWQLVQYDASACDTVGATQGGLSQDLSGMDLADDEGGGGGAGYEAQAALMAVAQAQVQATAAPAEVLEAVVEQASASVAVQPSAAASLDVSAWMEEDEGVEGEEPPPESSQG